ncbi:hypothetical protein ACEUB2_03995 [Aeromonas veronii]
MKKGEMLEGQYYFNAIKPNLLKNKGDHPVAFFIVLLLSLSNYKTSPSRSLGTIPFVHILGALFIGPELLWRFPYERYSAEQNCHLLLPNSN